MLELRDLKQDYGSRCVLDIPLLQLRSDGHYAVIGSNGAGKTTLLRALMARFKSTSDPSRLGYLPQKPYAFAMQVRQNIELGIPRSSGLTREEKNAQVDRQLELLDLAALAHQRADRLSGGETQKMALARMLVIPRQILLLDEPTNSMDMRSLQLATEAIKNYLKQTPCLLVLVSHQLSLIRELTNELLYLDQGRILDKGPTRSLLNHPENEKLARFLQIQLRGDLSC